MKSMRVAVVGGGIGGLTAAGLLAKEGHDVTLFEGGPTLGGKAQCVQVDGLRLDTGPTLLTLPDVVKGLFERLGAAELLPPITELEPQCTYRFADGCGFVAYKSVERTADSAGELRPSERRGVHSFYAEAEDIWRAYAEADIYVQTPAIDNMPNSVIEAFASGLPVVSTGIGGVPAILQDGVHGLLAPDNDDAAVAAQVVKLLEDPAYARSLAAAAYATCDPYEWSVVRTQWLSTYRELARSGASAERVVASEIA